MNWAMTQAVRGALRTLAALGFGLALGLTFSFFAGESPWHVGAVLLKSAFGSRYDLGMTLFYTVPLVFTGLSVAVAFRAGLFNIGAEGQMALGAMAAAASAISLGQGTVWWIPALVAMAVGALWGGLAGWIRAYRHGHEVIATIMLNFVAAGVASFAVIYKYRDVKSQNPETLLVPDSVQIAPWSFFGESPVGWPLVGAIFAAGLVWWVFERTVLGFQWKAVGQNERAAFLAGIPTQRVRLLAMMAAGALAGAVGIQEVLGYAHRFKVDFSPGYGFIGIAVALLAGGHPMGILGTAFLFGALHKGTADLDFETANISRDLSQIIQALIILAVAARTQSVRKWMQPLWPLLRRFRGVKTRELDGIAATGVVSKSKQTAEDAPRSQAGEEGHS